MHDYICKNKVANGYDLYYKECAECGKDGEVKKTKHSGIALGLYDDDDDENCCF